MSDAIFLIAAQFGTSCSVLSAAYLAAHDKPASTWAWFLFVGVLLSASVRIPSGTSAKSVG
jgi:hypothetical protein